MLSVTKLCTRALILYRPPHFINHLLTYSLQWLNEYWCGSCSKLFINMRINMPSLNQTFSMHFINPFKHIGARSKRPNCYRAIWWLVWLAVNGLFYLVQRIGPILLSVIWQKCVRPLNSYLSVRHWWHIADFHCIERFKSLIRSPDPTQLLNWQFFFFFFFTSAIVTLTTENNWHPTMFCLLFASRRVHNFFRNFNDQLNARIKSDRALWSSQKLQQTIGKFSHLCCYHLAVAW